MAGDVDANAISRTSSESSCHCRKLKIRSGLSDHGLDVKGKLVWNALHQPLFRWKKKVHTFKRTRCILDPAACALCRLVSACFEASDDRRVLISIYYVFSGKELDGKRCYTVVLCVGATQLLPLGIDAHLLQRSPSGYARLPDQPSSDQLQIQQWLRRCEWVHELCKSEDESRASDSVEQPKRLINVRKMCVEQSQGTHRRYLALSYVWGRVERKVLSTNDPWSMSQPGFLLREISGGRIHTIVQDAIHLTRQLRETYLWVDSLCICQNNLVEKREEIAHMNVIFKGAVMTIVALDCESADDRLPGISTNGPPRSVPVVTIDGVRLLVATTVYPFLNPARDRALGNLDAGITELWTPSAGRRWLLPNHRKMPGSRMFLTIGTNEHGPCKKHSSRGESCT